MSNRVPDAPQNATWHRQNPLSYAGDVHDRYIPVPDGSSRHSVVVDRPPEQVWPVVRKLDMSGSRIIRFLFAMRGMKGVRSLPDVERLGFGVLEEIPGRLFAIGVIGRPWEPGGGLVSFDRPEEWESFTQPGYAKISWTFVLTPIGDGKTGVSTETRVLCTDDVSRRRFSRYWTFIGPFSGLIRREMLRGIEHETRTG